jgi:phytoene dehydrogenase-like protein
MGVKGGCTMQNVRSSQQIQQPDTVVIGGGLAGLTAACYLARAGTRVTLFEKASALGGRAATQNRDGFHFNRGIHAVYTGGPMSEVLADLGVTYRYGTPEGAEVLDGSALRPLPTGPLGLLRSDLLSWQDKLEMARLFATLPRINARKLARVTVEQWLDRMIRRPQVLRLFRSIARVFVYSDALDLVSAEVLVAKLQVTLKHPVQYVDHGWQSIADGLRHTAEQAGARIVTGTGVAAITVDNGQVAAVVLEDGSTIGTRSIVVATTPHDAAELIGTGAPPSLTDAVAALIPAKVACLDVALRRLPSPQHSIVQDLDRPLFFSTQSRFARIAPKGGALIHIFKQLDPRRPTDPRDDERDLESLLDAAQPGWRDAVVRRVYLPQITAVGTLPTARGGGFAGRPDVQSAGIAGLYLAGDWIGPEGFLSDPCFASARRAAGLIINGRRSTPPARTLAGAAR